MRTETTTHFVYSIANKHGDTLGDLQEQILHRQCVIYDVSKNRRGWIGVEMEYDPGVLRMVHLSKIQDLTILDADGIIIETENTRYYLKKLPVHERKELESRWINTEVVYGED